MSEETITGTDERIAETVQSYRKYINDNPELLSLLYDIDLLPEQIRLGVNCNRMVVVCELYKQTQLLAGKDHPLPSA